MVYSKSVTELIRQRYSCRRYFEKPIEDDKRERLIRFLSSNGNGPLGSSARFQLFTATEKERDSLKGLGTYGVIRGATGFIIGAVRKSKKSLEDYGYLMERAILFATDIRLGTCWLGGTFTRSRFAKKISTANTEIIPAVASIGYSAERGRFEGALRQLAGADNRLPWEHLFFRQKFGDPLPPDEAEAYADPLAMVRMGPSASNKQPWRIIKDGNTWHFYMQRTKGYGNSFTFKLLRLEDLQRVDMGIAMSHFELTANERGLKGKWVVKEPQIDKPDRTIEYTVSWAGCST